MTDYANNETSTPVDDPVDVYETPTEVPDTLPGLDVPEPTTPPIPANFDPGTPGYITDAGSESGMAASTSQPTQVAHPGKATARTLVAYILAALIAGSAALPLIADALSAYLPPKVIGVIAATAGVCGVLVTLITRIMALPAVNDFLSLVKLNAHK
jgi:hypothetical protein